MTQQTISRVEHGDLLPRDVLKLAIAEVLECEPGELFAWPAPSHTSSDPHPTTQEVHS